MFQCFETRLKFLGSDWLFLLRMLRGFGIQWIKAKYVGPPCILVGSMGIRVAWRDYGLLQAAFSVDAFGTSTGGGMTTVCRALFAAIADQRCVAGH